MKEKQNILITGATSFLGKRLIKRLKKEENQLYLPSLKELNLLDFEALKRTIKKIKPDIIYHLGALVDLSRDYQVAKKCLEVNTLGTLNLLEALRDFPPQRFIFTSTEEVYGNGSLPFKEDQLPQPPSAYSISKLAAENFCQIYAQELGFSLIIFRIGTFYGPEMPLSKFIAQVISKALKNEDILLNSGTKKRDYVYIDDVVEGLMAAQKKLGKNQRETINLGGGESFPLKVLAETVIRLTGSKSKLLIGALPERAGEANEWLMDNGKAKKLLGWQPKTSLEEGLRLAIEFFRKSKSQ